MKIVQYGNNNIFLTTFILVDGETSGGRSLFLKNLRMHMTLQANLCFILDTTASIESAYYKPKNG